MLRLRHWLSTLFICSAVLVSSALAQSTLTQVRDTVTNPDGSPFNGIVVITWNGSGYPSGSNIAPHSTSAQIYTGILSVLLVPTTTASATSYYVAVYSSSDGMITWSETWAVPSSTTAVTLSQIRTSSSTTSSGSGGVGAGTGGSGTGASGGSGSGGSGSGGNSGTGGSSITLPISISDVSNLSTDLAGINTSLTTVTATANTLNTTVASLNSTSTGLQTSVNGLTTTVNGLTSTVNGQTTSISALNTSITGLTNSQATTAGNVTSLTTTVNGLTSQYSGLNATVTAQGASVTGLTSTVNGVSATVATQGNSISGLNTTTASLTSQFNGLSSQVGGISSTVTALNTSVTNLTATVNSLSSNSSSSTTPLFVNGDTVGGTLNGTNTVFSLTSTPFPASSLQIFRNGLMQTSGVDYSVSGSTVTFMAPSTPQSTDTLTAFYQIPGTGPALTFVYAEQPSGTVNNANATFTLVNAPRPGLSLRLYKNGMLMLQNGDYSLSGSTITFTTGVIPQSGDLLAAYYTH